MSRDDRETQIWAFSYHQKWKLTPRYRRWKYFQLIHEGDQNLVRSFLMLYWNFMNCTESCSQTCVKKKESKTLHEISPSKKRIHYEDRIFTMISSRRIESIRELNAEIYTTKYLPIYFDSGHVRNQVSVWRLWVLRGKRLLDQRNERPTFSDQ